MSSAEPPRMLIMPRIRPLTLLLFAASWLIFEWFLFSALSRQIGTFGAVLFHVAKGGFGLFLLALVVRRVGLGLPRALRNGSIAASAGELFASFAGATLIALPGLIPTFFGLALFSPSIRRKLGSLFVNRSMADTAKASGPQEIDLEQSQWESDRKRDPRS
jgi:UPF0716 family protein affecting phage T7 exclusion